MTITQRALINLVLVGVGILRVIEQLGAAVRWTFANSFRLGLYLLVMTVAVKGFYLESSVGTGLANLPAAVSPTKPTVLGATQTPVHTPVLLAQLPTPTLTARAVLAKDLNSGASLLDVNSNEKLAPASTTKLMTAMVALDLYSLDEVVQVPEFCTTIEGQKTGFHSEDTYTAQDLVQSLLINSSADAACALSLGKISYSEFVEAMNVKAANLELSDTHFTNPVGLDSANGDHVSTARDLYELAKAAVKIPLIAESVQTKQKTITSLEGNSAEIANTNQLLWNLPGTAGIKTGTTVAAGEVLIYRYTVAEKDIIIVVMGSQDRFLDTQLILTWILASYGWGA